MRSGFEALRDGNYTAENIVDRFDDNEYLELVSEVQLTKAIVGCYGTEELAFVLSPSFDEDDIADYECAVEEYGEERARSLIVDLAERFAETGVPGSDPELDALADACSRSRREVAEAEEPVEEAAPETTTTTVPVTPTFDAFAAETPPLLVADRAPFRATRNLDRTGDFTTPDLPVIYLDNGAADPGRSATAPDESAEVVPSPDGSLVALRYSATAIDEARHEIVSLVDGEVVESVPYEPEGRDSGTISWSLDGRGFFFPLGFSDGVLHRVGAGMVEFSRVVAAVYLTSNEEATAVVICSSGNDQVAGVTAEGETFDGAFPACREMIQVVDADGDPYLLYIDDQRAVWRYDAGTEPTIVIPAEAGGYGRLRQCDRVVSMISFELSTAVLYDMFTGQQGDIGEAPGDVCPVVSPDGSRVAYQTAGGAVSVLTFGTGEITEVANAGVPWSFSADGERLLVAGGGTFIVASDGSGGAAASIDASSGRSFCRAGESGLGLVATETGVVLFDVGTDTAMPLALDQLPETCFTTLDGRWLLAGGILVDLETRSSLDLHRVELASGRRIHDDASSGGERTVDAYYWLGPQRMLQPQEMPRG